VISKPGHNGPPKVFIGSHLNNAIFKDSP
jgi:hypothetical protein